MNKITKYILNGSLMVVTGVALIVGNLVLKNFEGEISTVLSPAIVNQESLDVSSQNGQLLSRRILEEGATLLWNKDNTLPLSYSETKKVNVFGWRSVDWIYGSEGQNASGGVSPEDGDFSKNVDIFDALNDYGIQYNERLEKMYNEYVQPDHQSADLRGQHISNLIHLREPNINDTNYYTQDLLDYSENFSDTAIVMISRMAGEGMNANKTSQSKKGAGVVDDNTRHYLELSTEEEALLKYVGKTYKNAIVLMNMSNPFECGLLESIEGIDACMYIGFTGTRAAGVLPSLLYGEVSPSGHLVDTFAYDMFTNPGNVFAGKTYTDYGRGYTDYVEGVYVGYKWYETADVEGIWDNVDNEYGKGYEGVVQFPFGYGSSYNTYSWTVGDISIDPNGTIDDYTQLTIPVTVKNEGQYPGREVVQVYMTPEYHEGEIEKSHVNLVGFGKTEVLQPGAEATIEITIDCDDFTSYDCYDKNDNGHKGYELEEGKYIVSLRTDSHTVKDVTYNNSLTKAEFDYFVEETIKITEDKVTHKPVGNLFTGEDAVDTTPLDANEGDFIADIPWFTRSDFLDPSEFAANFKARACTPSAKISGYSADRAKEWDAATVDEFGDPVPTDPVVWGAKNNMYVAKDGVITELGKALGADYDHEDWNKVLEQVTIAETVEVINNYYGTDPIASVGKPSLRDLDGPAQIKGFSTAPRGTGYPTMVVIASTWNQKLAYEFGKSYGDDMKSVGCYGIWGWAIDCHRSAFFGRNHESPSEDPILAGAIIKNAVKGLNTRGRYAFLKHFALYGYSGDSIWLSEQAFREIYLKPFREAFVEGGALGCMTTYQGIGAEHSETTIALLTGVLRKEWDFKGAITTDYIGNKAYCDAIIRAGGNLGMGVSLGSLEGVSYNENSSLRLQHRLKEAVKQILYSWLRADYNEQQYLLNPDTDETFLSSFTIDSWVWWKPLVTCINVGVCSLIVMWASFLLIDEFVKSNKEVVIKKEGEE